MRLASLRESVLPSVGLESVFLDVCFQSRACIMHQERDKEQVDGDGVGCGDGVGGVVGCTGQRFVRIHG